MAAQPNWIVGAMMLALGVAGLVAPASAHPHVFIEARTKILYDNGNFTGVEHRWTFDEFYTQTAIEGLDANKDGFYSREELAELAKVNIEGLKEFAYFTFPKLAGKDVAFAEVKDYWLEHKDGALTLIFTLPFSQSVLASAPDFKLSVADPTFFIGFDWAKDAAVTFSANAPKTCTIKMPSADAAPAPAQTDDQALRGAFAQQFGAGMVMPDRAVQAICPKG
jgi:ABC-type uncharacterized transport system substrate-binding protein